MPNSANTYKIKPNKVLDVSEMSNSHKKAE